MIEELAGRVAELVLERLDGPRWLTLDEAAEHMRFSRSWLKSRLDQIPHSKVDGRILFDKAELDRFITNRRRLP